MPQSSGASRASASPASSPKSIRHTARFSIEMSWPSFVLVHGFDTRPEQVELRAQISKRLRSAAGTLGIPLVEVSTTVRDLSDRLFGWVMYHGGDLAGVAHMLDTGACLSCCVYLCRFVQGRLASAPRPIVELGCCSGRTQRWGRLSRTEDRRDSPQPRRPGLAPCLLQEPRSSGQLRQVREVRSNDAYPPCAGVLEQAPTFPNSISPRAVRSLRFKNDLSLAFVKENVKILEGRHRRALRAARRASVRRVAAQRLLSRRLSWAKPSMRSIRFRIGALPSSRLHT